VQGMRARAPSLRQEPKCHICAWSPSTQVGSSSAMCALSLPITHVLAQTPSVTTRFFFNDNNNF